MICKAAEIILTLSATFKASADQQSVDVKTDFTFLGHDDLFSQIYMTPPEGQTQVIARAQSISLIHCLFRLVKCKFTEPHYKSAWYTLLSLLIFSTYALSIKREGRNLTEKKKRKYRGCCGCCIPLRLCSQKRGIAILRLPRQPYFTKLINYSTLRQFQVSEMLNLNMHSFAYIFRTEHFNIGSKC